MKRLVPLFFALTLGAGAQPYQNPVIPFVDKEIADPHVLRWNGEYYMYCSGDPVLAFHSCDLVHWDKLGPVLTSTPGQWNETDVWAPEVIYRNGKFLMYYTAARKGDWRAVEMSRRVGVAVSDSPAGPFRDVGHPISDNWAIDGHVFQDQQGQDWMFYSSLQEPQHPGAGIAVDRLVSFDRTAGQPVMAIQGTESWEDKDSDPENGSLRYTNEGPTVIERNGQLTLFYSGGSWDRPNYAVGTATATRPQGPWTKNSVPMLRATPLVDGPGHDALTKAPNGMDDVHFYHARPQPYLDPWNRAPFTDRLFWLGSRPAQAAPFLGLQAAPEMPLFRDLFDGPLGSSWRPEGGTWQVSQGVLHGRGPGLLHLTTDPVGPYLFECNVSGQGGIQVGSLRVPAPSSPGFHQIVLRDAKVYVDGMKTQEVVPGGLPALWTSGSADFDGVTLTSGFQDTFGPTESKGWEGDGAFQAGLLQNGWRCKGPLRERYEFSATLQPQDTTAALVASPGPTDEKWWAGLVAARNAKGEMLYAGFDKAIWPFGRFRVWSGKSQLEAETPRGFRYDRPHTLRVLRYDDAFTFFLDGSEILNTRSAMGPAQAGFFTQGVPALVADAAYKQVVSVPNLLLNAGFETDKVDPWKLTGAVRLNESSAHGGVRRLLWQAGQGRAEQFVPLAAGQYRLHAFVLGDDGAVTLQAGTTRISANCKSAWQHLTLDFEVKQAGEMPCSLTVQTSTYAAADDVWLEQR